MATLPNRGFSTLELMIAIMILTTTLSSVALITLELPHAIQDGHTESLATDEAHSILNQAFSQGLTSFSSVTSIATSSSDNFDSSLQVILMPDGVTKHVLSTVSWINSLGQTKYEVFSGLITDFKNAKPTLCSNVTSGDWLHPIVSTDQLSSYAMGIVAVDASTTSELMVLAATSTQLSNDPSIEIFSISSTTKPLLLSQIDNASSVKTGLAALVVNNSIIYGANFYPANFATCVTGSACSQLQIIDATDSIHPSIISNFQLSTSSGPYAIGSGGQSVGKSISYANGRIYLGLQKIPTASSSPAGEEFNIIDVQNPRSPRWLGGYSVGRTINQIQVQNGYAYLATDDPTRELIILDVSDPGHITQVGSYDAPGYSTFGYGEAISFSGTTITLGRSYTPSGPVLLFLNTSKSNLPQLLGTDLITDPLNSLSIQEVLQRGFLSFVLTGSNLQIWNIQNIAKPNLYGTTIPLPTQARAGLNALACKGNTLYVVSNATTKSGTTSYLLIITAN